MVQFQSTLAYLKDPPPGYVFSRARSHFTILSKAYVSTRCRYLYPAVDIVAGLQNISDSLESNAYTNEYDFQNDISRLIASAHDGHFVYSPDILNILYFIRSDPIYSVSKDGTSLPEIYIGLDDVRNMAYSNSSNYTVSPVTKINDEDVENWLNAQAAMFAQQDPDANYNLLFPILNCASGYCGNLFTGIGDIYLGSDTIVTFRNGSTRHIDTYATSTADFTGVTDGPSFFKRFCTGKSPTVVSSLVPYSSFAASSAAVSSVPASTAPAIPALSTEVSYTPVPSQTAVPPPPAFPKPWVIAHDSSISCYFPSEQQDLTVLAVPTFGPENDVEFSDIVRECLATANKLGKKKLVIDLRGNGGGKIFLGYDMFKQLFPSVVPWGTSNARAFPLVHDLGEITTDFYDDQTGKGIRAKISQASGLYLANNQEDIHLDDFDSWEDFYGPVHRHGDTFTNLMRYNLTNKGITGGIAVSGHGNLTGIIPKQTFASEDIVLLQDGVCASTCTIFSEFMKTQSSVGQVAAGGRKKTGPMQGVGGVKGAEVYQYDNILASVDQAFQFVGRSEQQQLQEKYGAGLEAASYALDRAALDPTEGGHSAKVNIRNNIREGDTSGTPLHFVYEAADCRIFYTAPMITKQSLLWKATYDAYWGNGSCVSGSTGQWSSKPGVGYIGSRPGASKPASPSASGSPSGTGLGASPTSTGGASSIGAGGAIVVLSGLAAVLMLI